MTDRPAIIAGSLVDAKNVHTHKSLRLIIDVPAEHAQKVFEAFGWPTMANPVSVAVARLSETVEQRSNHSAQGGADRLRVSEGSRPASASPASERKPLPLASKVALTCREASFHAFLRKDAGLLGTYWCDARNEASEWSDDTASNDSALAEAAVKKFCGVIRKRQIAERPQAVERWKTILASYEDWQRRAA